MISLATLKDIAKEAGVSVTTASYAMNGDHRISEETAKKVLAAAEKNHYYTQLNRKQRRKKMNVVAVFLHTYHGPFYGDVIHGMQKVFEVNGYDMIINLGKSIKLDKFIDGAIICNPEISNDEIRRVTAKKLPIVTLDRELIQEEINSVVLDNFDGAYQITKKLIEKGCKSFSFIGGATDSYDSDMRWSGFQKALTDSDLKVEDVMTIRGNFTEKSGRDAATFLLSNNEKPDAIVCANDEMAIGVMKVLIKQGVRIPQDIKVTGFDDIILSEYFHPQLATVSVNRQNWGAVTAYSLIHCMNEKENTNENKHIKLPVKVKERDSMR